MLSAERLAELQADADNAAQRFEENVGALERTRQSALSAMGTAAQQQRFEELMLKPSSFQGNKSSAKYQRLAALRAISGAPTDQERAFMREAWEQEKLKRTAEDPTWAWGTCRVTEDGERAGSEEMRAEPQVDPKECERRWALYREKRQAEFDARLEAAAREGFFGKILFGITKASDFMVKNVFGSLPLVGQIAGEAYKAFAPPNSEFFDPRASMSKRFERFAVGSLKTAGTKVVGALAKRAVDPYRNTITSAVDRAKQGLKGRLHNATKFASNKLAGRPISVRAPLQNLTNNIATNNAIRNVAMNAPSQDPAKNAVFSNIGIRN